MRPPRTIGSNSTVSTLSLNRYGTKHGSDPRLELTPNELESLLNESFEFSATPTETAEPPKFPTAFQNSKFHLHKKEMSGRLVQRFKKSHKRTSIKLIDALCSILESELQINNFDYLPMHESFSGDLHFAGNEPFEKFEDKPEFHQGRDEQLPPKVLVFILVAVCTTATHFFDATEE